MQTEHRRRKKILKEGEVPVLVTPPEGCIDIFEVYQSHFPSRVQYKLHGYFTDTWDVIDKYVKRLNQRFGRTRFDSDRFHWRHRSAILLNGKYYIVNLTPVTLTDLPSGASPKLEAKPCGSEPPIP